MPQRNNSNRSRNGRSDQSMMGHWGDTARDKPFTTAAAAAGAVAAGVFLWSKRSQITDQISRLSDQITDWADEMRTGSSGREMALTGGPNESSAIESSRSTGARSGSSRSASPRGRGTASPATGGQSAAAGQNMSTGAGSTRPANH